MREDIKTKSSLRYINPGSVSVGVGHHVWSLVHDNIHDSGRAQINYAVSLLVHTPSRATEQCSTSLL